MIVSNEETAKWREKGWLRDQIGASSAGAFSRWIARQTVGKAGSWLMELAWSRPALLALTTLLLGGSIAAAVYDVPIAAFGLAALAMPVLEAFLALSRLAIAPFGQIKRLPLVAQRGRCRRC